MSDLIRLNVSGVSSVDATRKNHLDGRLFQHVLDYLRNGENLISPPNPNQKTIEFDPTSYQENTSHFIMSYKC